MKRVQLIVIVMGSSSNEKEKGWYGSKIPEIFSKCQPRFAEANKMYNWDFPTLWFVIFSQLVTLSRRGFLLVFP